MSLAGTVARGRRAAEARMLDQCTITRVTGQTLDEDTDEYVDVTETIYTGKCRVKVDRHPRLEEAGETAVDMRGYIVELPFLAPTRVARGDVHTTTVCDDPWLVGVPLKVVDTAYGAQTTARRLMVQATA